MKKQLKSVEYIVKVKVNGKTVESESYEVTGGAIRRASGMADFIRKFTETLLGLDIYR